MLQRLKNIEECKSGLIKEWVYSELGAGALHIFPDTGIKNGINFHNFGARNGTDFQDFGMKYKVGYTFQNIDIRNGHEFEASMARPRQKSGQVHPPGFRMSND